VVLVLDGAGDRAAGATRDEPREGAAELAAAQAEDGAVGVGDDVGASGAGAVGVDPNDEFVELSVGRWCIDDVGRAALGAAERAEEQVFTRWLKFLEDRHRTRGGCSDDPGFGCAGGIALSFEDSAC
jgi:hypothetical protein